MLGLDLAAALDPDLFARKYLNFEPDPWQTKLLRSLALWILVLCCRQSGKTTTAAFKALHRALFYPNSLILVISPSQRQSELLFEKVVYYLGKLPRKPKMLQESAFSLQFPNGSRIVCLPSTEATVRGYSAATLIIEDEASRVPDELYMAVRPMLAVSGGQLILLSTPNGRQGHFFEEWTNGGANRERYRVIATDCPRIQKTRLDDERRRLGERFFRQEYFCEFTESKDQVFAYDIVMKALSPDVKTLF